MRVTKRKVAWFVLGCLLALAVLLVLDKIVSTDTTIGTIRHSQKVGRDKQNDAALALKRLIDCTTLGHKCYDDQVAQTARYLGAIAGSQQESAAAGAYCANRSDVAKDYPSLLRCIRDVMGNRVPGPAFKPSAKP